jgi:(2Fe-2S) ferredoxin
MARLATTDQRGLVRKPELPPQPMGPTHVTICSHPNCPTAQVFKTAIQKEANLLEVEINITDAPTFCRGTCTHGPYVGLPSLGLFYGGILQREAAELVKETCLSGRLLFQRLLISPRNVTDSRILFVRQENVLVLLEEKRCPLAAAGYLFRFNAGESCGKCTPCRLGVPSVESILRRFEQNAANEDDVKQLRLLLHTMSRDAYCEFAEKVTAPLRLLLEAAPDLLDQHVATGCPQDGDLGPLGREEA